MSATDLSSRIKVRFSPGSPSNAKPGARRLDDASALFPKPPNPPLAATKRVPFPTKSAKMRPSFVITTVPFGTPKIKSSPSGPFFSAPYPCLPELAER